jgi:hypothetical protein
MGLNLHAAVRGAINAVNPDILGVWRESSGSSKGADYRIAPSYTDHVDVHMQVQALKGRDLQHPALLSVQGVTRAVYMFGTVQGVSKPQAKGGDLLQFRMIDNGPYLVWLVVADLEQWNPAGAWSKVAVVLQTEAATTPAPDVVGDTLAVATAAIEAAGLVLGDVTDANSPSVPIGDVISQTPAAAVRVPYDTEVALVISLGPTPPP